MMNPHNITPSPLIPLKIYQKLSSFIFEDGDQLKIATSQSQNLPILQDLIHQQDLEVLHLSQEEIDSHLAKAQSKATFEEILLQIAQDEDLAIKRLLDFILQEAISYGSSDIHFDCTPTHAQIRIRIDSVMQEIFHLSIEHFTLLSSSLKLECSLDIHERRKPQDGRFGRVFDGIAYDFRFSSLPTTKGESLVLRILCKSTQDFNLASLGFSDTLRFDFPYGLVFITGPTGSGKSTTLYALLESIKSIEKKIITLEDPVEYDLDLLTQVAINEKYGFGFKEALRFILRQDPDIIMVGEIRDDESLSLAMRASLTGHLVLSTLHTNDALSTIERLFDMHAKPYLIASILNLIIAQRLARRLCPHCKTLHPSPPLDLIPARFHSHTFYRPNGCPKCHFKGYSGRILIYESLYISQECRSLIAENAPKEAFHKLLKQEGFVSLFEYGITQASLGNTSLEEILKIAYEI